MSQCPWLAASQRFNVENCIRTLSEVGLSLIYHLIIHLYVQLIILAKNRGIAIPLDLESQVAAMFNKATILTRQTSKWLQASKTPKIERSQSQV